MKKLLLISVLMSFLGLQSVFAQGPMRIGGEANLALPYGDLGKISGSLGFGVTALFLYPYNDQLTFTGRAGWLTFGGESVGNQLAGGDYTISGIPIQGGVRYYMDGSDKPGFYFGGEAGFHIMSFDFESNQPNQFFDTSFSESSTEFTIAPVAGYQKDNLDISAVINFISDVSYFGIRAGYTVPFGN